MAELTVKRWRRYGKDRVYANDADGARVGWLDLQTDEVVLEREDLRKAFERALAPYREATGVERCAIEAPMADPPREPPTPTPAPTSSVSPPPPPPAVERDSPTPGPPPPPPPTVAPASRPAAAAPFRVAGPRPSSADATDEAFAVTVDWRDLAAREAGAATAEQARAAREAAPVRTMAARLLGVHTDERAWRIGAKGERLVAARLEKLPGDWRTLHAVPVGDRGSDIDHVVIGPGGVFTINAKHHPDANVWVGGNTCMVNGHRLPYIRNSRHEAKRAGRLLSSALGWSVQATGVIAIVGAHRGFTVKEQPSDVHVVTRKRIARWLTSLPTVLTMGQVEAIYAAGRRSDTWR
jgi:hypothetical protein